MAAHERGLSKEVLLYICNILNTGTCREHGRAYAVYLITVTKHYSDDTEDIWDVYRRYSDFHDFHMILQERVSYFNSFGFFNSLINVCIFVKK